MNNMFKTKTKLNPENLGFIKVVRPWNGWGKINRNEKYYIEKDSLNDNYFDQNMAFDYLGYKKVNYKLDKAVHIFANENAQGILTFIIIRENNTGGLDYAFKIWQKPTYPTTGGKKSDRTKSKRSNKNKTRKTI